MKIKNKTAGHAGIACFSFALKGNRAGSPHFKIVRFKWWEHVTIRMGIPEMQELWLDLQEKYRSGNIKKEGRTVG